LEVNLYVWKSQFTGLVTAYVLLCCLKQCNFLQYCKLLATFIGIINRW